MATSERVEVIRSYIDCYNRFDVEGMLSLMTDEIRFENFSGRTLTASASGKEEFESLARLACELFIEREQKIVRLCETANRVEADISYSAVFAKDQGNGFVAGRRLVMTGKSTFEFEDSKIRKIVDES